MELSGNTIKDKLKWVWIRETGLSTKQVGIQGERMNSVNEMERRGRMMDELDKNTREQKKLQGERCGASFSGLYIVNPSPHPWVGLFHTVYFRHKEISIVPSGMTQNYKGTGRKGSDAPESSLQEFNGELRESPITFPHRHTSVHHHQESLRMLERTPDIQL